MLEAFLKRHLDAGAVLTAPLQRLKEKRSAAQRAVDAISNWWRGRVFKGRRASPNDLAPQADTRVRGERTQSATTIYGNAGRPKGAAELATVLLRCILFAALITPAMVLAVELLVPTRGTQTRTLYAGATDL